METGAGLVLEELAASQANGRFSATGVDGRKAEVFWRSGLAYSARVDGAGPQLGEQLVGAGVIGPAGLEYALHVQRSEPLLGRWRLGELVVHLGIGERPLVEHIVTVQLVGALTDLTGWSLTTWRFRAGKHTRQDISPLVDVVALVERLTRLREPAVAGAPAYAPVDAASAMAALHDLFNAQDTGDHDAPSERSLLVWENFAPAMPSGPAARKGLRGLLGR
jgi:hypothetical protein